MSFRERISSEKARSSLLSTNPSLSLSNPCLQNLPPIIPVSVHHQLSRFPVHSLSTDSYYTRSVIDRPLTSLTSGSRYDYKSEEEEEEKKKTMLRTHLSDQYKNEHDETMKRYDRLLEKIRTTDEELQSLSRSWTNNIQQSTSVSNNYFFYQEIFRNYTKEWLISG